MTGQHSARHHPMAGTRMPRSDAFASGDQPAQEDQHDRADDRGDPRLDLEERAKAMDVEDYLQ